MVLDDIPNDAILVKVPHAPIRPEILAENDLHVADKVAAPQRLKDEVGKAQHCQIFDELFAQVVVDAVDLILGQVLAQLLREGLEGGAVPAKGLFHDDPAPPATVRGMMRGMMRE